MRAEPPGRLNQAAATQAVSLSWFRFEGFAQKHWALWQMLLSRPKLRRLPGVGFLKMVGTGTREGFHPFPNFGVYGVLAAWPSLDHARAQVSAAAVFRRYRAHASEAFTVYLTPSRARGAWAGAAPFDPAPEAGARLPVAVLTRAAIRPAHVLDFWRRTPGIRATIPGQAHLLFQIGMGEVPWLNQITFTIWDDFEALRAFAYRDGPHSAAIEAARADGWFAEELFARFHVAGCEGTWGGASPLAAAMASERATTEPAPRRPVTLAAG